MEALSSALAVLTAMITPAVLISACGALILSTSTRLGRVTDRVRLLIDRFEEMAKADGEVELYEERRAATFDQLDRLTARARPARPKADAQPALQPADAQEEALSACPSYPGLYKDIS